MSPNVNGAGAAQEKDAPEKRSGAHASHGHPAQNSAVAVEILPAVPSADKRYATLAARFALAGHALMRTDRADGPVSYFVTRWGQVRTLRDLDAAEQFLEQVTGVGHG